MKDELLKLRTSIIEALSSVTNETALEIFVVENLGRKSAFATLMKSIGTLEGAERAEMGKFANVIKGEIEAAVVAKRLDLADAAANALAETERLDVSMPATQEREAGHFHLTTQAIREVTSIFERIGFRRVEYPEVEWDWYAFEALNMPSDHPARDEWETFFIDAPVDKKFGKMILTPHTSSGQVREMERAMKAGALPIRMINIAKCYRRQSDVTHVPMFHQFEGLLVDRKVSVTHLKGTIEHFVKAFFGPDRTIRLRPYHFQFTEPSFEIDVSCGICGGSGTIAEGMPGAGSKCRVCKEGWLELGGAGMVHPNVLKAGGIDPEEYSGFAFGWGVERTMLMKSGLRIDDIREMYRNDLRFLKQF
jgi:phenylalanyl-tRNA synthetase alpha chain